MKFVNRHLMVCGECGANFSVEINETSKIISVVDVLTNVMVEVNRKDKPRTCTNGAEHDNGNWMRLVLQLSIQKYLLRLIFSRQYFKNRKELGKKSKVGSNKIIKNTELV